MNAVKRCLALIAATVVVSACSGDPTADLAGKDLTIRATPGAVWMQQGKTTTILLEALDATGAPAPGNWNGVASGVASVTADTAFEHTSTGHVGNGRQYIISSSTEGNGSVTFTGTGGNIVVPVRVAPDPAAFNAVVSNLNPAIAASFTVTAPAGLRFTSTTGVNFVVGPTTTNGLAAPTIVSMSPDSTVLTILPAPGATGFLKITGIASIETPTLKSTATTVDSVTVPALTSVAAVIAPNPSVENRGVTLTMPANFLFRPSSVVSITGGPALGPVVASRTADSTAITIFPVPGFNLPINITDIKFVPLSGLLLPLPTTASLKASSAVGAAPGHVPHIAADDAKGVPAIGVAVAPSTVGGVTAYWDSTSFTATDYTGDCGAGCGPVAQYVRFTATRTGNVNISIDWTGGTAATSDLDMVLLLDDGAYATPIAATVGGAFVAATGSKPQAGTWALTNGTSYVLGIVDFGKSGLDGPGSPGVPAGNTFRIVFTGQ